MSTAKRYKMAGAAKKSGAKTIAAAAASYKRPKVIPGYTRTGGFYKFARGSRSGFKAEVKFFDTDLDFLFDQTAEVPATGQLALIPQGDTQSTRDGRQATIKSLQLRAIMTYAPAASTAGTTDCWLWLVLDTQTNGAAAAITDVFTSNAAWDNMINLSNSDRFKILKKWKFHFQSQAGVSGAYQQVTKPLEYYKKCNIPMQWSSTTGAITEIRSNNIFLMAGGFDDDLVTFSGTCRLRFVG